MRSFRTIRAFTSSLAVQLTDVNDVFVLFKGILCIGDQFFRKEEAALVSNAFLRDSFFGPSAVALKQRAERITLIKDSALCLALGPTQPVSLRQELG